MSAPFSFAPRRELGRTGFRASALGVGDLADRSLPLETCVATLRRALDCGLNLVDTAPSYEDGYSERIVGRALKGRRDGVFLIDKVDHWDRPVAPQIAESLARLELPSVELFVFHGFSSPEDFRALIAPGGRFDELCTCRDRGQTRFVGISSHHPEVLHEALRFGRCDVLMFPVGPFVDARYVDEILPEAKTKGVGSVCFKTFGAGKLLGDTAGYGRPLEDRPRGKLSSGGKARDGVPELPHLSVAECVRYTLTCDPDVALLGLSFPNEQDAAFAAARDFEPFSRAELEDVRARAARAMAGKGHTWWNPE
ncbi:MAG TPA: aldo/keto reductase [Polyangiaceae bacterium]|jgi:aryl-alcohol dehydrogenase-like predicted oxidoreductase